MEHVLDMNPRMHAKRIMDRSSNDIRMYAQIMQKDCPCEDHEGPHDLHLSRIQLYENYHRLSGIFDHYTEISNNPRMMNELLAFFFMEMERQKDFVVDIHLRNWALPFQGNEHGSTVT